jgi:hypothetical protein
MKIQEIEKKLPHGFHDAIIERIALDFSKRNAHVDLDIWVGNEESKEFSEKEKHRKGYLDFIDFEYLAVEPPNEIDFYKRKKIIDIVHKDISKSNKFYYAMKENLPEGYLLFCFYMWTQSSLICFIAKEVEFNWIDIVQ